MTNDRDDRTLVRYEVADHTAVLTLDRPEVRNAIDPSMASAIEGAVDRAEQDDDVWLLVLASSGDVFCAGVDLRSVASGSFAGIQTRRGGFAGLVQRERTKPLIAAVDGAALAGGFEIALAADLIVASTRARFGLPEVKRSLVAAAGGAIRLPRVLPRNLAMRMLLTGEPIDAGTAAAHGLVTDLAPPGKALERALRLAATINANAPLAVRASRETLLSCLSASEEEAWRISRRAVRDLFATEDFLEGPRAFVEKRDPVWKAR